MNFTQRTLQKSVALAETPGDKIHTNKKIFREISKFFLNKIDFHVEDDEYYNVDFFVEE